MVISLGSDPEFFITDKENNLKSIIGLIGGTKDNPRPLNNGYYVQEDNVAAEYNIPPSFSKEEFIYNIHRPQELIAQILGTDKYSISNLSSAVFPRKELKDPKALEFGCDPDYNAWTGKENPRPKNKVKSFRTAGGHIHLGLQDKDPFETVRIIRNMDKYLGVWSVIVDPDTKRRSLYGKAGAFRPQPHGAEYRSLSNFWIFDANLISEVWDRTQYAVNQAWINTNSQEAKDIVSIINTGNKDKAQNFLKQHRIL